VVNALLGVVGDPLVAKAAKYLNFKIECKKPVYVGSIGSNTENSDATPDGAFTGSGQSVLFGDFYPGSDYPCPQVYTAIRAKGFPCDIATTVGEFTSKLPHYTIGIFTSNNTWISGDQSQFVNACKTHLNLGKGLFVWGDNEPYFLHANLVLNALFGMSLVGNTPADKILSLSWTLQRGTFLQNHIMTTGVSQLYEGFTICYPSCVPSDMEVLAHSTDGNPCILYAEKKGPRGRVVIDCGFTKLGQSEWPRTVGTARYVTNAICWLTGASVNNQLYLI